MSLSSQDISDIRNRFMESARPLIYYDDDPDGLCSFLQFYSLNPDAKGIIVKTKPFLSPILLNKIEENEADLVVVLDIADVPQEFIDGCKVPMIWIDHHSPIVRKGVKYYNPMISSDGKDNRPISYWSHLITEGPLWLSMVGCAGDWHVPDFSDEFSKEFSDILPPDVRRPDAMLFETRLGRLARMFSFILKGENNKVKACVKTLTKIKDPHEILDQTSSEGKYIHKEFEKMDRLYQDIMKDIKPEDGNLILYTYEGKEVSFTSEISNELLYRYPGKFIVIGRKRSGDYKLSLRSSTFEVLEIVKKALVGVEGYGGGHRYACGANVKEDDFDKFLESIRKQIA